MRTTINTHYRSQEPHNSHIESGGWLDVYPKKMVIFPCHVSFRGGYSIPTSSMCSWIWRKKKLHYPTTRQHHITCILNLHSLEFYMSTPINTVDVYCTAFCLVRPWDVGSGLGRRIFEAPTMRHANAVRGYRHFVVVIKLRFKFSIVFGKNIRNP